MGLGELATLGRYDLPITVVVLRGRVPVARMFFVGDAVCTTNPAAGRGVALGLGQARALIGMLDGARADHREMAHRFDAWCTTMIRPWFEDHVHRDASLLRRFQAEDIDLDARIPSDVVCAAAVDPPIWPAVAPYLGMLALPSVLDGAPREKARALLRTGWRPPIDDDQTRESWPRYSPRTRTSWRSTASPSTRHSPAAAWGARW